ncbi:MAG: membrane protein [candidate division WS6 bacterium 34_10]|uniref:Membrane protein n=1 Tax=candidate division WS6 bacterium 34_10 TaxID=1641389 RepID=A0A101HGR1_9BACT|nr:MAG: membrane protein [candidate division WS6 bacterium 34_10]
MAKKYFEKKYSKLLFGILALLLLVLAILVAKPYLNTIILAVIVSYILQPVYKFLTKKVKTKKISASIISTLLIVLLTMILGVILVITVINVASLVLEQVNTLRVENTSSIDYLQDAIVWINSQMDRFNIPIEFTLTEILSNLRNSISSIVNNLLATVSSISSFSVDAVFKLIIFYGLIYTIVPHFNKSIYSIKNILPLDEEITTLYLDRTLDTAKAMAGGVLLIAIVQGLVAGIILYILGTPYVFLISLLVSIVSFIPLLGTGLVTFPIALIYILTGQVWKGVVLAIYQLLVIGEIDGVLRANLIPKDVRMPLFVSFIAIFGGLSLWGIWGLIYGPVIFILLLTTVEVLKKYYIPSLKEK